MAEAPAPAAPSRQVLLQKIYVKDASLEVPMAPQVFTRQWQPQLDVQVATHVTGLSAEQHQVVLQVTATAKLDQDVAFLAEVHQAGIFLLRGFADGGERQRVLGADCPAALFPFVREAVADLVVRGGFPQLLLQPIDFAALYEEHLKKHDADKAH
jgi:preprotein translocase subunit SecB